MSTSPRDEVRGRSTDVLRILRGAEQAWLVRRARGTSDRHRVGTRITEEWLALLASPEEPVAGEHRRRLGAMDEARLGTLVDLLAEMNDSGALAHLLGRADPVRAGRAIRDRCIGENLKRRRWCLTFAGRRSRLPPDVSRLGHRPAAYPQPRFPPGERYGLDRVDRAGEDRPGALLVSRERPPPSRR
jgi:hypothetical protein